MPMSSILRRAGSIAVAMAVLVSLPASAARPVHQNGATGLMPWHQLDLDAGKRWKCNPSPACGEEYDPSPIGGSDLRIFFDVKATELHRVPLDDPKLKLVRMGKNRPSYAACRDAEQTRLAYAVNKVGVWYCARTSGGRIARLKYLGTGTGIEGGGRHTYDFRWTTWSK